MNDPSDESHREIDSFVDLLRHIFDTAIEAESSGDRRRSGTGRHRGRIPFDYGFTVDIGLDSRKAKSSPLIDVRSVDDGLEITADVQPATRDDISIEFDHASQSLIISSFDSRVERIPLDWQAIEIESLRVNNGILDIHIRPKGATNHE